VTDGHAVLAPSAAGCWGYCPGSVSMGRLFPDRGEWAQGAEEGNAAHWVMDATIKSYVGGSYLIPPSALLGVPAPNGLIVDQDMVDAVKVHTDDVLRAARGRYTPHAEVRVEVKNIHADNWGTLDTYLFAEEERTLYLWDLKYGWSIVDAVGNLQAANYAIGLFSDQHVTPDQVDKIVIRIVQPRPFGAGGPIRQWTLTLDELRQYGEHLRKQAEEAMGSDPQCRAFAGACKHCPARHACPALNRAAADAMHLSYSAIPEEMDATQLGRHLTELTDAKKMLEARISGIEEQARSLIKSGSVIPGWIIEVGQGRQNWTISNEEVMILGRIYNKPLSRMGVLTPKQAITEGIPPNEVARHSTQSTTGAKLVPVNSKKTREAFK